MKKNILCVALAALVAVPLTSFAAPRQQGEWYLAPSVGYGWADSERLSDDGLFLGFGMGTFIQENWAIEGNLGYNRFDRDDDAGLPLEWRQLSVSGTLRYLWDYDRTHPYLGFALGFARNEIRDSNNDDWGFHGGPVAGWEWDINDNAALRIEVGHKYTDYDDGALNTAFWDTTASVGYSVYFGRDGVSQPMPPAESPPMPSNPPMDDVAPAPEPEPNRPLPVSITLNGVNFDFDKCTLRGDAITILEEAVRVLNGNDIRVEVAGHTDAVGTDAYNQKLSECRATVVGDYLTGNGVAGAKISSVNGYGESKPIDSNDSAEGRARNRRTELNVQ